MHTWKWSIEWMNVSIENGRVLIDIKLELYDQSCFPWIKYMWMYRNVCVLFSSGGSKPFRKPWFLNQTWIFSSEVVSRPRSQVNDDFGPLTDPRSGGRQLRKDSRQTVWKPWQHGTYCMCRTLKNWIPSLQIYFSTSGGNCCSAAPPEVTVCRDNCGSKVKSGDACVEVRRNRFKKPSKVWELF